MIRSRSPRHRPFAPVAVGLLLAAGSVRADGSPDAFLYQRPLVPSRAGPTRVDVDFALIAGAQPGGGLRDLRIRDEDGREVPYLLVAPVAKPSAPWRKGRVLPIPATAK
ncbi:MAG: hypothetical protein ACRENE_22815, partial [Polyangiaceae bacterium]